MKLLRLAESAEIRGIFSANYTENAIEFVVRPHYNLRIRCVEWLSTSTN
jgi:hypothetical protein